MNIFLEAAHLSPIAVLCIEFRIPRKQEAAARVAAQLQMCKETGVMLGTITAPRQMGEKSGYTLEKRKSTNNGMFVESAIKLKDRAPTSCWAEGLPGLPSTTG